MFFAVVFISLDNAKKPTYDEMTGDNPRLYAFLAVLMGIITPMTFAIKSYFIRMSKHHGYDAWTVLIDNYSLEFTVYGLLIFFYLGYKDISLSTFLMGGFSGTFILFGKMLAFYAFKDGIGGVVNSLISLQIIVHVILNWIVY